MRVKQVEKSVKTRRPVQGKVRASDFRTPTHLKRAILTVANGTGLLPQSVFERCLTSGLFEVAKDYETAIRKNRSFARQVEKITSGEFFSDDDAPEVEGSNSQYNEDSNQSVSAVHEGIDLGFRDAPGPDTATLERSSDDPVRPGHERAVPEIDGGIDTDPRGGDDELGILP